mgnify:CR=1 FL=1
MLHQRKKAAPLVAVEKVADDDKNNEKDDDNDNDKKDEKQREEKPPPANLASSSIRSLVGITCSIICASAALSLFGIPFRLASPFLAPRGIILFTLCNIGCL